MVRTKDLLLIVVVLVMLSITIFTTLASRMVTEQQQGNLISSDTDNPEYNAAAPETNSNRAATIDRLRALLAQGDVIEASPSVEVSPVPESEVDPTDELVCGTPGTGIDVARIWPLENLEVKAVGVMRMVAEVIYAQTPIPTGTGTPPVPKVLSERILLQLPLGPTQQAEPTCPSSEIIGVTVDGSLIFNNDAVLYRSTGPAVLIGYALDGFPIYGAYAGERDRCGGYQSPTGYRYAASLTEPTFLSCFSGAPRTFSR